VAALAADRSRGVTAGLCSNPIKKSRQEASAGLTRVRPNYRMVSCDLLIVTAFSAANLDVRVSGRTAFRKRKYLKINLPSRGKWPPQEDRSQKFARLLHLALATPEACEAHGDAEFPGFGLLLARSCKRMVEKRFRLSGIRVNRIGCCPWPMAAIMAAGQPHRKTLISLPLIQMRNTDWVPFKGSG
jgi:hypothetical protein